MRVITPAVLAILDFFKIFECCTTILVTSGASASNATMCAHSADCSDCDSRVALVPNRIYNSTSLHQVWGIHHRYPRERSDRAAIYLPSNETDIEGPFGYIPEVKETFGMWESVYGMMNEHGLTIGESSIYARINAPGVDLENPSTHEKGPALFSIAMLIQVALERCKTAVCAVRTMGSVSEQYGFYGETFNGGEALSIADPTGEGWIFHILPDPTGRSSIWCARRVPQGHVAAVANQFTISTINSADKENYMHSKNMYEVAVSQGLWNGSDFSEFKFNHVFGSPGAMPMYISVRLWYIYNSFAPSLNLSPRVNPFDLPFSVPVDRRISLEDVMGVFRSHYEGTEFDMTKGILAGPFGNPQRVEAGQGIKKVGGQITRPISIQRTAYTMIGVADPKNAVVYYATDTPATSVFVPFLARTLRKAAKSENLKESTSLYSKRFQTGKKTEFDRFSAWWAFDFVANWMNINYRNMSQTFVQPAVKKWQPRLIEVANTRDEKLITAMTDELVKYWWKLADTLIVTYNDGYYTTPDGKAAYTGYPEEFLRSIGFNDGFVFPVGVCPAVNCPSSNNLDQVEKTVKELHYLKTVVIPNQYGKTVIANISDAGVAIDHPSSSASTLPGILYSCSLLLMGVCAGFYLAKKRDNLRPVFRNNDLHTSLCPYTE